MYPYVLVIIIKMQAYFCISSKCGEIALSKNLQNIDHLVYLHMNNPMEEINLLETAWLSEG